MMRVTRVNKTTCLVTLGNEIRTITGCDSELLKNTLYARKGIKYTESEMNDFGIESVD